MTTLHLKKLIGRSPLRLDFLLIPLLLVCLALSPSARAGSNTNTSLGLNALPGNTTGTNNTAVGFAGLKRNTSGNDNTAIGAGALFSNSTGNDNIALGVGAGDVNPTGSRNIYIGHNGLLESNTIRIGTAGRQGRTFIAGISGATVTGAAVFVNGSGQLGTVPSSARFKDEIKPMDKASEAVLALKPVTFRYKHELDPDGIPQFGLVAEEVAKVNPALVARDAEGKVYTVRYEAINAMLLNEFIKEHQKVQRLEAALAAVNERLKAQDAKIDKVNAQVELTKPAPQMVVNDQ
jgi:Chaperone of endosialidase